MTSFKIVHHPDPRLKIKTQPIVQVNDEIKEIAQNMIEAMYLYDGVGLAAPQVGVKYSIFVLDCSEEKNQPQVFMNPVLSNFAEPELMREACLSFPGISVEVMRSPTITVDYLDMDGNARQLDAEGLMAHCIQHETDHVNGVTMLDHLSRLKRDRASKKVIEFLKNKDLM
jgi:peptide deformylase